MTESARFTLTVFLVSCVVLLTMHALGMWFVTYVPGESVTVAFGPVTMYFYPDMFPALNR